MLMLAEAGEEPSSPLLQGPVVFGDASLEGLSVRQPLAFHLCFYGLVSKVEGPRVKPFLGISRPLFGFLHHQQLMQSQHPG